MLRWETLQEFAKAKISDVHDKKLGEITEEDYIGHEKFVSHDEMMETYKKYYGEKVTSDTLVKIIKFKLI